VVIFDLLKVRRLYLKCPSSKSSHMLQILNNIL
jgi:hypothetical protein